jgi:predicted TIM-barrel fold metal-dependent hydrolase
MSNIDFRVIDGHCHLGALLSAEELLPLMDTAGVEKAVVFPISSIWSLPHPDNYLNTNDYIADAQAHHPDRLIGFACINPCFTGDPRLGMPNLSVQELERSVLELGLFGVKLHPENHYFAVDDLCAGRPLAPFMDALVRLQQQTGHRIPMVSHGMTTLGAQPDQFARLAADYPEVSMVIAHGAGYQNLRFASKAPIAAHPNLYVDTSMMMIDDTDLVETARLVGIEKIIFGTDHFNRAQANLYGNSFYVLERAFPDPADRRRILGGNLSRILG